MSDRAVATLGRPVQIAYAVPDAAVAAVAWERDLGAGPFVIRRNDSLHDVVYRGRPATFDHTSAYGQWGSMMVELVEDHSTDCSPVRDMYGPGESGLHHLAFFVPDLAAAVDELVGRGHDLVLSARTGSGLAFHFLDARATHGHMIELYEPTDHLHAFYAHVAALAG